MDATERARLRALCEAATPGPWDAIYDEDAGEWMVRTGHADVAVLTWQQALDALGLSPVTMRTAAFIAASRTAIPALLDALDAAERERDEARAGRALAEELACAIGVERDILRRERDEARAEAVAAREHTDRAVDEIRRTLPAALRLAAEDEREACAAIADAMAAWAAEHSLGVGREEGARTVAAQIRARGAGGAR